MLRISAVVLLLVGLAAAGILPAQAQQPPKKNSCSLETCISICSQRGGRTCDRYCQNEMARRGCR